MSLKADNTVQQRKVLLLLSDLKGGLTPDTLNAHA